MTEWHFCRCGNVKAPSAAMCRECFYEAEKVEQVPTETRIDPVRDAFEWIIAKSRGEIS